MKATAKLKGAMEGDRNEPVSWSLFDRKKVCMDAGTGSRGRDGFGPDSMG
jgi:hypothetical protein